ncbi:MAG TPA: polyprenyl synthetase family protein [Opitutaceae bacterium]|jgi:octaprenyl-diphosphate synthase
MTPAISPPKHVFSGVFELLERHLAQLDRFLAAQPKDFEPEIREMVVYAMAATGKRIRPALVFLSGWQGPDTVPHELIRAAAVVELIHLATLVHDDIMDDADIRRNRETAARKFGSTPAVLLGDALFAHALNLATQFSTTEVCAAVSDSTRRVCAGEIVQTMRRGSLAVSREEYSRIIELKTAELFRVSCLLGARLADAPGGYTDAAACFGRHLGVAYQIYDDLADYFGHADRIGKTLGTDLASGKVTLPLFILLERLNPSEAEALRAEVVGGHPPRLAEHSRQMRELGVFDAVQIEVESELTAAREALTPWRDRPSAGMLLGLADLLQEQLANLR